MNTTRSRFVLSVILLSAMFFTGCSSIPVPAGYQAVTTEKPRIFGHGGISSEPVSPGLSFVALTTDYVMVSTAPVTIDETFDDAMPKDNNPVDYHASVKIRIVDTVKMVRIFGEMRTKEGEPQFDLFTWYKANLARPFQTMNRNHIRQHSMPDLALQQTVIDDVETALKTELGAYAKAYNLPIEVMDVVIGKVSPQQSIMDQYNETGVQQQNAKTQVLREQAEKSRKGAEKARAEADKAYQDEMGLNAEQFVRLEQLKTCREVKCTMIMGPVTPIMTVK